MCRIECCEFQLIDRIIHALTRQVDGSVAENVCVLESAAEGFGIGDGLLAAGAENGKTKTTDSSGDLVAVAVESSAIRHRYRRVQIDGHAFEKFDKKSAIQFSSVYEITNRRWHWPIVVLGKNVAPGMPSGKALWMVQVVRVGNVIERAAYGIER